MLQEQEKQKRIRGLDAQKANIQAARAITRILKSSLGPKGMDKMLQGPDGDICISALLPQQARLLVLRLCTCCQAEG